jgi:hypothetical protein
MSNRRSPILLAIVGRDLPIRLGSIGDDRLQRLGKPHPTSAFGPPGPKSLFSEKHVSPGIGGVEAQVLDKGTLLRMRDYLNREDFMGVVEGFLSVLRRNIGDLQSGMKSPEELRVICHDLINISGTLGMVELMFESERLMALARSNSPAAYIKSALTSVVDAAVRALSALQACLV